MKDFQDLSEQARVAETRMEDRNTLYELLRGTLRVIAYDPHISVNIEPLPQVIEEVVLEFNCPVCFECMMEPRT